MIVEDEPIGRNILQGYVQRDSRLVLAGSYRTALDALPQIREMGTDLLFLDIQMPELSGIELLKSLSPAPMVIFTTAFREFALDAFELNAVDYLLKPFPFERFLLAVNKAAELSGHLSAGLPLDEDAPFFLRDGVKLVQLRLGDILYAEALREYVKIVTATKTWLVHQSMKSLEEKLPAALFVRIHKSYIVAIRKISSIEGGTVLIGKVSLPISRRDKSEVLDKITKGRFIG
ncbi:MAG TPA: LytTR family DNA-binding domain-containing protein [Puia sp.]|nr:LytTR family DNA-binding domain-containing protein [Puia sp.]